MVKYQNIFVTGSGGFIGKSLFDRHRNTKTFNLIRSPNLVEHQLSYNDLENIDLVIHLFGIFGDEPETLTLFNLISTHRLMKVILKQDIKKIIFLSSGAVYGDGSGLPSKESGLARPKSNYGLSKLITEEIIKVYCDNHGINYLILRLPNVYGKDQRKGVIFNFHKQIKEQGCITIEGSGKQTRDFLHISDLLYALDLATQYDGQSEVINISSSVNYSINDLANLFSMKYNFEIQYADTANEIGSLCLDIDKARNLLGYEPKVREILID
ncbi:NAD-dependent epimerase/dehydratase family protein [Gammaproteobacteria bacterium]|nr:NAD-dependent epimerase/dehydratase family protein [Gammaproteobacteria bacterium]